MSGAGGDDAAARPDGAARPDATGPLRVAVLASGSGTNLQAILDGPHADGTVEVVAVLSDQADAGALDRAARAGVPAHVFPRKAFPDRASRDLAMAEHLEKDHVGLVVLAGYMAILDGAFTRRFAGRLVNVHPSLLPAFPGIRAMQQALDYGVKVFGVTVHLVDEGVDTGPVLLQGTRDLPDARTEEEVHAALRPLEHELLTRVVRAFAAGTVRPDPEHPRRWLTTFGG